MDPENKKVGSLGVNFLFIFLLQVYIRIFKKLKYLGTFATFLIKLDAFVIFWFIFRPIHTYLDSNGYDMQRVAGRINPRVRSGLEIDYVSRAYGRAR
jgi:hypothetical protein